MSNENPLINSSNTELVPGHAVSKQSTDSNDLRIEALKEVIRSNSASQIVVPELEDPQNEAPEAEQEGILKRALHPEIIKTLKAILIVLAVAVLVCLGVLRFVRSIPQTTNRRILENVYVAGVDVGNMYQTEAIIAVESMLNSTLYRTPLKIMLPGQDLELSPQDSSVMLDTKSAVEAAYSYGNSGEHAAEEKAASQAGEVFHVDITPYLQIDEAAVRRILKNATDTNVGLYTPSSYSLEGNAPLLDAKNFDISAPCQTLVLNKGVPGSGVDPDKLYEKVLTAYRTGIYTLDVSIPDSERKPEELDLDLIYRILTIPPTDAVLDEATMTVSPGQYGYSFDLEDARTALAQADYGTEVRIPMQYVAPCFKAGNEYFQDVLGYAEIPCKSSALEFSVCNFINLTIVEPMHAFSLQPARLGLQPTTDCLSHPVEDDGICMAATALYQSALKAGLSAPAPTHHNYTPSYCEKGFDVCASGYSGFQFTNTSASPVILLAEVRGSFLRVQILGTKAGNVHITLNSEVTSEQNYSTQMQTVSADSGYADGQVLQAGINPCTVSVSRQLENSDDGTVTSELIQTIGYMGCPEIIAKLP